MIKLVTHNGVFHADEAMACAIVLMVFPDAEIIRTRDKDDIASADIVVDVGGVYDPHTNRYDHHQPGFTQVRDNGVPYSSAGLVWRAFAQSYGLVDCREEFDYVDRRLIQGIDAQDCGVELCEFHTDVRPMTISAAISGFNPMWDEPDPAGTSANLMFTQAVKFATEVLDNVIVAAIAASKAKALATKALEASKCGPVVVLEQFCPWQDDVCASPWPQFVVFPDATSGTWRVQAVPVEAGAMKSRCLLPEAWRGLNGDQLDSAMGVGGGVFVHKNGFIGGHATREGAIYMAEKAIS